MVDILLSVEPNYFAEVEEGIWYRETFSLRKSFCLDAVIEVTKVKNYYLVIRNDRFAFPNNTFEEFTYAYILRINNGGILSEFKIYVDSRDKEVIKNTAINRINSLNNIIIGRTICSDFCSVGFHNTSLLRQSSPTTIVLSA